MITKTEKIMKSSANCSVNLYWPNGSHTSRYATLYGRKGKRCPTHVQGGALKFKKKKVNQTLKVN